MNMDVSFITEDPDTIQIKDAIDKVISGKWVLAPFQRPETWGWKEQNLLLDSLVKGIPIGMIYLWGFDRNKDIPCRPIPGIPYERNKVRDLIIDGQQRLSFLSWLKMKAADEEFKEGPIDIFFNLKTGNFSNNKTQTEDITNGIILVHKLYKPGYKDQIDKIIFEQKDDSKLSMKMIARVNSLHLALTERYISFQRLDKKVSIAGSFKLYERVNVAGAVLKGDDYVEAGLFGVWPEMYDEIKQKIKTLTRHPEEEGKQSFNDIFSRSNFIRSILDELYNNPNPSSRDKDPMKYLMDFDNPKYLSENGSIKTLTPTVLKTAFNKVSNAFEHYREILTEDFYAVDSKGINATFTIPVNTFLRTQGRGMNNLIKGKFIRWFVLFHIHKNVYLGSQDRKILEDCNAARQSNPFNTLDELLVERIGYVNNSNELKFRAVMYGKPGQRVPSRSVIDFLFQFNLFLAINRGAKDWFRDKKLLNITRTKLHKHHIFPKSLYPKTQKSTFDHIGNIARIIKYTNSSINNLEPSTKRYIPDILIRDKSLLTSQQIPINDKNIWKKDRIKTFINKRIELLCTESNELLQKLNNGTWEDTIPIPIISDEDLLSQEESQKLEFKETLVLMTKIDKMKKDFMYVISKEVAGFMNNGGGILFIGVKDKKQDGRVVGLQRDFDLLSKNNNPKEAFQTALNNRLRTDLKKKNFDAILSQDFVEVNGKTVYKIEIPHIGDVRIKKMKILDSDTGELKKVWKDVLYVRRGDQTLPDEYIDEKGKKNIIE